MQTEKENLNIARKEFHRFGTEVDLQILTQNENLAAAKKDILEAEGMLEKYEKIFSRFDKRSELQQINSKAGDFLKVSKEMLEVALLALQYNEKSHGYFDPRVIEHLEAAGYDCDFGDISNSKLLSRAEFNFLKKLSEDLIIEKDQIKINSRMDFSGLAKGWFVDQVSQFFISKGWKNFVVDIGGDMYFAGCAADEKEWYIDIEGIDHEKLMFALSDVAIATSGIGKRKWEKVGKRFHHLINPRNPQEFLFDLKSVTVVSQKTVEADIFAKTIFLMGKEKGLKFAKENNIACAILDYKGNVFISPELKRYIFN